MIIVNWLRRSTATGPICSMERPGAGQRGSPLRRWPTAPSGRASITAAVLDTGLASLRGAIDAEIAASGSAARVQAGVLAALPRRINARRWGLVAASVVAAAALGALADVTILAPAGSRPIGGGYP